MAFLDQDQLRKKGFKALDVDVLISDKAPIYDAERIEIGDYSRVDDFCVISGKVSYSNIYSSKVLGDRSRGGPR